LSRQEASLQLPRNARPRLPDIAATTEFRPTCRPVSSTGPGTTGIQSLQVGRKLPPGGGGEIYGALARIWWPFGADRDGTPSVVHTAARTVASALGRTESSYGTSVHPALGCALMGEATASCAVGRTTNSGPLAPLGRGLSAARGSAASIWAYLGDTKELFRAAASNGKFS